MGVNTKSKSQHFFYQTGAADVVLDVVVGDGNPGALGVYLSDQQIATGPEVTALALGPGASLKGKEMHILATVRDNNPVTSQASVIATFTNVSTGKTRALSLSETSADGDVVALTLLISFA